MTEHLAGDLLPQPRRHPTAGFNESILGTGFWFLGEVVHSPVDTRQDEADRFDNMVDVMTKTFLGLTVACARCHDHKFDAVSTKDYYALLGFLRSSSYRLARFDTMEHNRQIAERSGNCGRKVGPPSSAPRRKYCSPCWSGSPTTSWPHGKCCKRSRRSLLRLRPGPCGAGPRNGSSIQESWISGERTCAWLHKIRTIPSMLGRSQRVIQVPATCSG